MNALDFYKKQSKMTNPGEYLHLFDCIPLDVAYIKSLLDGLILHFWDGDRYNYQIPYNKLFDIETRYVNKILKKIIELEHSPLTKPRVCTKRIVGSCRDYSILFCSILRHHGIPARARIAFSTYYFEEYNHDLVIVEYWNDENNKWCLIDPRVNEFHIQKQNLMIDFDLLDVPRDKLVVAGLAWQMVRDNRANADVFCGGNFNKNRGLWYIRDRLIQDFAALNSVEMQLWDAWGLMLEEQNIEDDERQLLYLDTLAELTISPDIKFNDIMRRFEQDNKLAVPDKIISFSPVYKRKEICIDFV